MKVSIDLLVGGGVQVTDESEDAPLMKLTFHNQYLSLPNRQKVRIMGAALDALVKETGGNPEDKVVIEDNMDEIEGEENASL